jgi:hypothetical protein
MPFTFVFVMDRRTFEFSPARATATFVFSVRPVSKKSRTLFGAGDPRLLRTV